MRNYILFLLLCILAIPKLHLFAQLDDITRLPVQDIAGTLLESAPVIISENEVIIFYVNAAKDTIFSTTSRDGGGNWEFPKAVIAVELDLYQSYYSKNPHPLYHQVLSQTLRSSLPQSI